MTTKSLDNLLEITNTLEAQGKKVSVKVLKTRGPRKGETMQRNSQHGRGYALGNIGTGDCQLASHAVGGGKGQTITKVTGLGKEMVSNLSEVRRRYAAQIKADRKAAALDRR